MSLWNILSEEPDQMSNNRPRVAFGRYPCCDAVRPAPIPEPAQRAVQDSCPSCGTRITRQFNGSLHVITLREPSRPYRNETRPAFKTEHFKANPGVAHPA